MVACGLAQDEAILVFRKRLETDSSYTDLQIFPFFEIKLKLVSSKALCLLGYLGKELHSL